MYDYGIFRYPLYLVLCPQLSPCMIMGYFVTLSILFFVHYGIFRYPLYLVLCPLWGLSLPSLSCSLSPTLTMYDYGIFRYPLYLVLCPQLSPCMIMGYFVTLSILFLVASRFCSRTICSFLLGHDVNISLILFTLSFALRILHLSAVPRLHPFVVVEYAWAFSTMSQEML